MAQIFDEVLHIEDSFHRSGYNEGRSEGEKVGYDEGYQLGWRKGCEIGKELGFYMGCSLVWAHALERDSKPAAAASADGSSAEVLASPAASTSSAEAAITRLQNSIGSVQVSAEHGGLHDELAAARTSFRRAARVLAPAAALQPPGSAPSALSF